MTWDTCTAPEIQQPCIRAKINSLIAAGLDRRQRPRRRITPIREPLSDRQVFSTKHDIHGAPLVSRPQTIGGHQASGWYGGVGGTVAASLDDVTETIIAAGDAALVALPVLVLLLAVALWILVGRTLAPVAAITEEANEISAHGLHRRVPEPARADEIGRLAPTLNRMLGRLDDAAQLQRRFVADAAHEL
jgi:signal transduction histidine kinase